MSSDEDVVKDVPKQKQAYTQHHDAVVHSVAFLPDIKRRTIVYGLSDGTTQLSTPDGRTKKVKTNGPVWVLAVSNDSRYIVGGGEDGKITVWNSNLDVQETIRPTSTREKITALNVSPDSATVGSGSKDGGVSIWSITSGGRLVGPLAAHHGEVTCIQFSPQGDRIATVANSDPSLRIWNCLKGDLLLDVQTEPSPRSLVWLSDEQLLSASEIRTQCLDTSTGSTFATCPEGMTQLAISHGRTMVAGLNKRDVRFWDIDMHTWGPPILKHDYEPHSIALFFYVLVAGGHGHSSVWNLTDPGLFIDPIQGLVNNTDPSMCERVLTEMIALGELQVHFEISTIYFTRAIVRSRMQKWDDALHDAEMAIKTKPSIEGYIAKSAILCYQGNHEGGMQAYDLAFRHAGTEDASFLLLVKAVLTFLAGLRNSAVSRVEDLTRLEQDEPLHRLVLAQMLVLLAAAAVDDGDYDRAMDFLTRAGDPGPLRDDLRWKDMSMITGWKLVQVRSTIYQQKCEVLLAAGRAKDAADNFHTLMNTLEKDEFMSTAEWVANFKARCLQALDQHGDVAMDSASYKDAVVYYTTALSLDPLSADLLIKRSKARAGIELWEDSLEDADAAIALNPSSPFGYERKHAALLGGHRCTEAIDAYYDMLLSLEQSSDPVTRELRKNYVNPSQTKAAIRSAVQRAQRDAPLVLVNTETGRLCDQRERMDEFEADPKFMELVASMTTKLDNSRIRQVAQEYSRYATFSHTWEGAEPLFHDVLHGSVHKLAESQTVLKLVMFCSTVREAGFRWAWCDTCCINKADGSVLQESLTSMFQWYHGSSLTIIHLKGVLSDSELLGALERSLWNTRAWTLQEFFASRVIRFYTEDWKPYLPGENVYNHKDSPAIMAEMARATGTDVDVLLSLRPGSDNDMAYSLFGIFDVSIPVTYGEGQQRAVGRLLQEVLTRSGDVSILAWTGKASDYNSCLPTEISVYREPASPYVPSPIEDGEMDASVTELRTSSKILDSAMMLYDRVVVLPTPRLRVYHTTTSAFGNVEIKTKEDLSILDNLVLVHPWLQCLLDPALPFEDLIRDDDPKPLTPLDGNSGGGESDAPFTDARFPSSSHVVSSSHHASQLDKLTRALRLFVRLRQPFGALLLVALSYNEYKRVASDHPIVVQLLKDASPRYLVQKIRTLDVL
ncbi:hypothetical protein HD554DRAFT_2312047 [Boletus coccyginus]|nr:hypothetical protein HD554DRAFT_2312047 [Boletus coccyginus]